MMVFRANLTLERVVNPHFEDRPPVFTVVMPLVKLGRGWVAIALAAISGCARPDYAESRLDRFLLTAGPQPGYAIKRVVEKQPPITLVGDDGSVCRVSPERFGTTREGQWLACLWNLPVLDSTQIARS